MDFLTDPGSTWGRISLFQQSVKMYYKFKCVLAKALMSMKDQEVHTSILFYLHHIKQDMSSMTKTQMQQNARIGWIEEKLHTMQLVEMPRSSAKDSAPADSSDG